MTQPHSRRGGRLRQKSRGGGDSMLVPHNTDRMRVAVVAGSMQHARLSHGWICLDK